MYYSLLILFSFILLLSPILFYYSCFYDLLIRNNTLNCYCQKEKKTRIELKGYLSDKSKVKKYINYSFPEIKTAKTLYEVENPEDIKNLDLPDRFVLKNSSGSRMNLILEKENLDMEDVIQKAKGFLKIDYANHNYRKIPFMNLDEPHYSYNKRVIIIEEFIKDAIEFRVMLIKGKIAYYEYVMNNQDIRFDNTWVNNYPIEEVKENNKNFLSEHLKKPSYIKKVKHVCEKFYNEFLIDFVRVDFYISNDEVYFGEFTFTPGNCRERTNYDYSNNLYNSFVH